MKIRPNNIALFMILFMSLLTVVKAQTLSNHKPWSKEDSAAINALVMYPDTTRLQIFEACEYPAAIVNIAGLQKNTSDAFTALMNNYQKQKQEDLWNLTRYPGLIGSLVTAGQGKNEVVESLLQQYPTDIRESAHKYYRDDFEALQKINNVQMTFSASFEQIIADLPFSVQYDFRDLIKMPEVLTLLSDHLELAVRVGDQYKRNPERVIRRADSLNMAEVRQNAMNAEDWKKDMQDNPEAQKELKQAADDYANENGFSTEEANAPVNPEIVTNYIVYPYPYWFGYPRWYNTPYWYPHPCWYDWGFYYDAYGNMIFMGTPNFAFINWYFYSSNHYYRYPHLGGCYVNHYYEHRRIVNANYLVVHNWVQQNRNYLPRDFTSNPKVRDNAIHEVGRLNTEYKSQARGNESEAGRAQFYNQNQNHFPTLKETNSQPRVSEERNIPNVLQEPINQQRNPERIRNNNDAPKPTATPSNNQRIYNYPKVDQGQNYHRTNWESAPQSRPSYQAPAPSRSPSPAPSRPSSEPSRPSAPSGGGHKR